MSDDLHDQIKLEIFTGLWQDLKIHSVERDAVILVAQDLDLVIAAEKVAKDEVKSVQGWIQSGRFARPSVTQLESWEAMPQKSFRFVIVQPYVLIQELGH
jgi:hypothetical protein